MAQYKIQKINRNNSFPHLSPADITTGLLETNEGDWLFGDNGDLVHAKSDEVLAQTLLHALRTAYDESPVFPLFGSHIKNIIGTVINPGILDQAEELLITDLLSSGFPIVTEELEILPYENDVIIVHVVMVGEQGLRIDLTYQFDVLNNSIEELGGGQI